MPAIDVEPIRSKPARNSPELLRNGLHLASNNTKHLISKGPSVERVDQMKMFDVQHNGIHRHVVLFAVHAVGILKEIVPVVQAGQRVDLCGGDQCLRFFLRPHAAQHQQCDDKDQRGNSGQHNGHII